MLFRSMFNLFWECVRVSVYKVGSYRQQIDVAIVTSSRTTHDDDIFKNRFPKYQCQKFGQWTSNPVASTCLLTSRPIWATGRYACGSKWNIEWLAKYPTVNFTAFGWNNIAKYFNYQILTNSFVLNLKMQKKKLNVPFFLLVFYYWSWCHKAFARHLGPYPIVSTTCDTWCRDVASRAGSQI